MKSANEKPDLMADIVDHANELGEVRYRDDKTSQLSTSSRKLLERKYFTDLVALVTYHVKAEFRTEKVKLLSKRREAYNAGEWQVYEDIVREIYIKQETLFNQMCEEAFDALEISKDVFLDSQAKYMADEKTRAELNDALLTGQVSLHTL